MIHLKYIYIKKMNTNIFLLQWIDYSAFSSWNWLETWSYHKVLYWYLKFTMKAHLWLKLIHLVFLQLSVCHIRSSNLVLPFLSYWLLSKNSIADLFYLWACLWFHILHSFETLICYKTNFTLVNSVYYCYVEGHGFKSSRGQLDIT